MTKKKIGWFKITIQGDEFPRRECISEFVGEAKFEAKTSNGERVSKTEKFSMASPENIMQNLEDFLVQELSELV